MSRKRDLQNRFRGWLPREHSIVLAERAPKPRWWKPLWLSAVAGTVAWVLFALFVLSFPVEQEITVTVVAAVAIGLAYYVRVHPSVTANRAVYVCLGCGVSFILIMVVYGVTGLGRYLTSALGTWPTLIVGYAVFVPIGILIGDWIGKRRNYQLAYSL